jgi:carbonic anhydrase/acetyltransferase-like protein (isoleucine patch superfamily)
MIYQYEDYVPIIGEEVFIAESADVMGNVELGDRVGVWFNAVIRGDVDSITVGDGSNVQDNVVLHTDPGFPLVIGRNVTIGHCAMVHGCTIDDNTLIGINAVVLSGAEIGKNCLIGANALVSEGMIIPDNSMVVGTPARVIREVDDEMVKMLQQSADNYVNKAVSFRTKLKAISPD